MTVGVQLPFDRLIMAVDEWAEAHPDVSLFAQTGRGTYNPTRVESQSFLSPAEFTSRMHSADAVVAHAGMGTILTSLELAKPLLVMPRRASLGEHRSDHQQKTAERFADRVLVAMDEVELAQALSRLELGCRPQRISKTAPDQLLDRIRRFVREGDREGSR